MLAPGQFPRLLICGRVPGPCHRLYSNTERRHYPTQFLDGKGFSNGRIHRLVRIPELFHRSKGCTSNSLSASAPPVVSTTEWRSMVSSSLIDSRAPLSSARRSSPGVPPHRASRLGGLPAATGPLSGTKLGRLAERRSPWSPRMPQTPKMIKRLTLSFSLFLPFSPFFTLHF